MALDDPSNPVGTNSSSPPTPRHMDGTHAKLQPGVPRDGVVAPATVSLELMVDFARIMGSFPANLDSAGTLDTAVQICLNASALHPAGRLPHLYVGASPYIGMKNDPTNTEGDAEEVKKLREQFSNTSAKLRAANSRMGSKVIIAMAQFDIESFGWSADWCGPLFTLPH